MRWSLSWIRHICRRSVKRIVRMAQKTYVVLVGNEFGSVVPFTPSSRKRFRLIVACVISVAVVFFAYLSKFIHGRTHERGHRMDEYDGAGHIILKDDMLFGLSAQGQVFFFKKEGSDSGWEQLTGPPCGLVWGKPIDLDASSTAIWVVCEREFMSHTGLRKEHFLFAKWGWSPQNNHAWWHMMTGPDLVQLDADDDAMWGVDATGSLLFRPSGNVGKHSKWENVDGPRENAVIKTVVADNDGMGTWLWAADEDGRLWRRSKEQGCPSYKGLEAKGAFVATWDDRDKNGTTFWTRGSMGKLLSLKADNGMLWAVNENGHLKWREISGACCRGASVRNCWCEDEDAPPISNVDDTGLHAVGLHFPKLLSRKSMDANWTTHANRWVTHLATRDDGHNAKCASQSERLYAEQCTATANSCKALNASVDSFLDEWHSTERRPWTTYSWAQLKNEYANCRGKRHICRKPLEKFGRLREQYLHHAFCCAREQLTKDPGCLSPTCKSYEMTCPGSRLLTSDLDCTVYHDSDPGEFIYKVSKLFEETFTPLVMKGHGAVTFGEVFDANLYGTWTFIPDEVFKRFQWPVSTKALFELVMAENGTKAVWVLKKKCMKDARVAIYEKLKKIVSGQTFNSTPDMDQQLRLKLKVFVGRLASGAYGEGKTSDWRLLFEDYRNVAKLQKEAYLTYSTTLEVVGRQQSGLPAKFRDDWKCMRQVSFLEQLVFIAEHVQHLPDNITAAAAKRHIRRLLMQTGKYFDRLLEISQILHRHSTNGGVPQDDSVIFSVLDTLHGYGASTWIHTEKDLLTEGEVRRRSCMDLAMWGNAGRHVEAFRADSGDLIEPVVNTFFTCLVPPGADNSGQPLKSVILASLQAWGDAVPPLDPPNPRRPFCVVVACITLLVVCILRSRRKRERRVVRMNSCPLFESPRTPMSARHSLPAGSLSCSSHSETLARFRSLRLLAPPAEDEECLSD